VRSITKFYNEYSADPVSVAQMFKLIARGHVSVGRDGRSIFAEEHTLLEDLRRKAAGVLDPVSSR
jgi:hypothetical protein